MFSVNARIWNEIQKRTAREILVLRIEKDRSRKGVFLLGNNLKFKMRYDQFDVIDLDSYGIPFSQLLKILQSPARPKVIFLTFIQSGMGQLPIKFLEALGYPKTMIKKCPTLFNRNGQEKLLQYLALRNIQKIKMFFTPDRRKTYLAI